MTDERAIPRLFSRVAYLVLAYTLAVIVFGAWVRITGSGAGCGQHWPSCNGEVVHRPESIETVIEYSHRLTSGLSLLFGLGLMGWALAKIPKPHPARWGAVLAVVFLIIEALLGAGLVIFGLVDDDNSVSRAILMPIHLTNNCVLMGALATAAWTGQAGDPEARRPRLAGQGTRLLLLGAALVGFLLVSMTGAVTALGDTLYPVAGEGGVIEHIRADQGVSAHFLQRVRVVHPALAALVALYLLWLAVALPGMDEARVRGLGNLVAGLVFAQLCAGVVNIMLSAPGWMQLVHLGLSMGLWTALVVLCLAALQPGPD